MAVISLGAHCYSAWLIKRMGLRKEAYPFDWLFSDPRMVIDCIEDEFAVFLNKKHHRRIGKSQSTHDFYAPKYGRPIVFNHHDITDRAAFELFARSSHRFLEAIRSETQRNTFLLVSFPDHLSDQTFLRLCSVLLSASRSNDLIAIRVLKAAYPVRRMTEINAHEGGSLYEFFPTSLMQNGLSFADEDDNQEIENLLSLRQEHLHFPSSA